MSGNWKSGLWVAGLLWRRSVWQQHNRHDHPPKKWRTRACLRPHAHLRRSSASRFGGANGEARWPASRNTALPAISGDALEFRSFRREPVLRVDPAVYARATAGQPPPVTARRGPGGFDRRAPVQEAQRGVEVRRAEAVIAVVLEVDV